MGERGEFYGNNEGSCGVARPVRPLIFGVWGCLSKTSSEDNARHSVCGLYILNLDQGG